MAASHADIASASRTENVCHSVVVETSTWSAFSASSSMGSLLGRPVGPAVTSGCPVVLPRGLDDRELPAQPLGGAAPGETGPLAGEVRLVGVPGLGGDGGDRHLARQRGPAQPGV